MSSYTADLLLSDPTYAPAPVLQEDLRRDRRLTMGWRLASSQGHKSRGITPGALLLSAGAQPHHDHFRFLPPSLAPTGLVRMRPSVSATLA